jgi:hypothetical protein
MKELSATDIDRELVDVLGFDAIAYSTVSKYPRSASFEVKGAGSDEGPGGPGTNLTDDQILHALEISSFALVCQMAQMTLLPKTMAYRHLMESLNFVNKKLHWVPHNLSEE